MDNWNDNLFGGRLASPVKTLTIQPVWYSEQEDADGYEDEPEGDEELQTATSMNRVARLINLLGVNLQFLNLTFTSCFGVSLELIKAVDSIKNLKSLDISVNHHHFKSGTFDKNSISDLLSVIPKLERLSSRPGSLLDNLVLKPPALSNLRYLSFTYNDDILKGISHIIQRSRNTLKIIRLSLDHEDANSLIQIFEPIKDTLEGLFTLQFTEELKEDVTNLEFPNLRVFGTEYCPRNYLKDTDWLNVPMLKNVRTFVSGIFQSELPGLNPLNLANEIRDSFGKIPNVKHVVFTRRAFDKFNYIHPEIARAFESNGIHCHLAQKSALDEIMNLN